MFKDIKKQIKKTESKYSKPNTVAVKTKKKKEELNPFESFERKPKLDSDNDSYDEDELDENKISRAIRKNKDKYKKHPKDTLFQIITKVYIRRGMKDLLDLK